MSSEKSQTTEQRLNALIPSLANPADPAFGVFRVMQSNSITINSTSPIQLGSPTAFSYAVAGAGAYHWRAHLMYVGNGTGSTASTPGFRVNTPPFTFGGYSLLGFANGPLVSSRFDNTSGGGVDLLAPAIPTNATVLRYTVDIEGAATFTSTGTLSISARLSGAATDFQYVIAGGSTFDVWPGY